MPQGRDLDAVTNNLTMPTDFSDHEPTKLLGVKIMRGYKEIALWAVHTSRAWQMMR